MSILALDQLLSSSSPLLRQRREEEEDEDDGDEESSPSKPIYLSEKPLPIDFYQDEAGSRDIMIDVADGGGGGGSEGRRRMQPILAESSGEDPEMKAPKKRAETWVQEETRSLISLRREMDRLFNTSKSNKHLWERISSKMRDRGFDRSPTMCTDKWRNLLKEFKKAKQHYKGSGSAKMSYYRQLDELLKERSRNAGYTSPSVATTAGKVDPFLQFDDKATGRSTVNLESSLDHDGHHLAITTADAATTNGVPPWNWRDASANGGDNHASYGGRIILVKCGEYTKRIGIDGTTEAIKEAIKSAFGLRTKRAFWLEDEDEVVRCLDREMPLGTYTLHLDAGVTVKVCICDDNAVRTEDKTFYTGEEFNDYLNRNNWTSLREINYRTVLNLDDLRPGGIYQGVRLPDD